MQPASIALLGAAALLSASAAQAAGFDCGKAKAPIELAICGDAELNRLDDALTAAFRTARASAADPDAVLADQRRWNQTRARDCRIEKAGDAADPGKLDCARSATERRVELLKSWNELGRVTVLTADPSLAGFCARALPAFAADGSTLPAGAAPVKWTALGDELARARFDFENTGTPRTVFRVDVETSNYEYHWFILPTPAEEDAIAGRLRAALTASGRNEEMLERLAADLDYAVVSPPVTSTANPALTARKSAAPLKSKLVDTSNTPLYRGWYTRPLVVQVQGRTLIAAESVNNLSGPTATLFKPGADGTLEALCYFKALPKG